MGFPRQEYGSQLPYPSPGDLPDPRIEPMSAPGKPQTSTVLYVHYISIKLEEKISESSSFSKIEVIFLKSEVSLKVFPLCCWRLVLIRKKRRLLLKCCWNLVLWAWSGDLSLGLLRPKLCCLSQSLLGGWQWEWAPSSILSVPWRQWCACVFDTQMKHFLHPLPLPPEFIFSNNPIIISENYSFSDSFFSF